jgi:hypothetical protein
LLLEFGELPASQRARRSARMRSSSCAPVSVGRLCWRHSAVSAPSTAAFRRDWRYCASFSGRLEFGHAGVEIGEQFFEFGDDAGLFCNGSNGDWKAGKRRPFDACYGCSLL